MNASMKTSSSSSSAGVDQTRTMADLLAQSGMQVKSMDMPSSYYDVCLLLPDIPHDALLCDQVTPSMHELYIRLLCQFEPENVMTHLSSRDDYPLDPCLRLCQVNINYLSVTADTLTVSL